MDILLKTVREQSDVFTASGRISPDVVELFRQAGVYRALVARRFGGDEKTPADFLRLIERIATVDGSAGWVASFGFAAVYLSALPVGTLERLYAAGPDVVCSVGVYPPQRVIAVAGGLEVTGRWSWGSGCTGADLIGIGVKVDHDDATGGLPLIAVLPRDRVTIVENWNVNGLKGTGSHDMVVDKVVVPRDWTFVRGARSSLDSPLYRYPSMALAAQAMAVVGLGVARAALDALVEMAGGHASITGAPALAERAHVQIENAKAEATLRSARAFFYEATEAAYDRLERGDDLDCAATNLLRLASSHAARTGADVARAVYTVSGTVGIFTAHPIARFMQDAMVVPQHSFLSEGTWQSAGRVLLGLDPPTGFP